MTFPREQAANNQPGNDGPSLPNFGASASCLSLGESNDKEWLQFRSFFDRPVYEIRSRWIHGLDLAFND
jgi:hypothetical protein